MQTKRKITKKYLIKHYINLKKSIIDISKLTGFSFSKISKTLERYNIPKRSRKQVASLAVKKGLYNHKGKNNGMYGKTGKKCPHWKGGKKLDSDGYIRIYVGKKYPNNDNGYVLEHRYIVEQKIRRYLTSEEQVHHINGKRNDNRIENLMLFANRAEHQKYHKQFILISNNLIKIIETDIRCIVRINIAWENTEYKLTKVLNSIFRPIFLDFPMNRTKFPLPQLPLNTAIQLANKYRKYVKYFAISNAESPKFMNKLRKRLYKTIKIVPKIETEAGIKYFQEICNAARTNICMLDQEDLFRQVNYDLNKLENLLTILQEKSIKHQIKILKLSGIVFTDSKKELK